MNGFALGLAMVIYSIGVSPSADTARATVVPTAFTFDLSEAAATSRNRLHPRASEPFRPAWRNGSFQPAQTRTAKRFSKTGTIFAVAVGALGGWMAGGAIGYAATSRPDDDVIGLRGVVIGAPIGSVVGAAIAYRLTK
jgi:hypothetical protein